jgi:SOS-response transcriptional repressor LexA
MHPLQQAILRLFDGTRSIPLNLRFIARQINEYHPQKIKHHLQQLEAKGFLRIDKAAGKILKVEAGSSSDNLVTLPVFGYANCGSALSFAGDNIQGFLKLSKRLLSGLKVTSLFVLRATGDSMNKAQINGQSIDDGDFVLVDSAKKDPKSGDYVVSVIDDCANIKRFHRVGDEIALVSESTKDFTPIFIHEGDSYNVAGQVMKIIKTPKF